MLSYGPEEWHLVKCRDAGVASGKKIRTSMGLKMHGGE